MKDFKRGGYSRDGGAGGPRREGGFGGERKSFGGKPSFGSKPFGARSFGDKRPFDKKPWENRGGSGFSSDKPMHDAICSSCGRGCQVPFKPNGKKPVLCNDCFAKQNGEETFVRNDASRSFDRPDRAPAAKPANDYRIDTLVKQMESVASKLDTLIDMMAKNAEKKEYVKTAESDNVAIAPKKAAAKKEAKKAAKPAKKTSKKK